MMTMQFRHLGIMALQRYREKRKFDETPEPTGGAPGKGLLQFVVQKHKASHLHYDFRLEIRGVLKSWAVPKGPSMDPSVNRLAMLVEDHPFDYKDFEGVIPEGNYGAGTVIIWDSGTYFTAAGDQDKKAQEHELLSQFFKGRMKFELSGKKLKGSFSLVKVPSRGDNSWLLTKVRDRYASKKDIALNDRSVASGETIDSLSRNPNAREWQSNRKTKPRPALKPAGTKAPMPSKVEPMLCTLTKSPVTDPRYLHEIKWDGYRIIAFAAGKSVTLRSRGHLDYTTKYPLVVEALQQLGKPVVLDGEVVVFNSEGRPDFDALQQYNGRRTPIQYVVFDIPWLDGYDLRELPLIQRKEILQELVSGREVFRFSDSFDDGTALYEKSRELNLEGIVSKLRESTYREGERGVAWLKTPTRKVQEFVIGGWAESEKNRSFRSLLFGAYENGKFRWVGRAGGGYKDAEMPGVLKKLKAIETTKSPFVNA
ncbi:MAG TPA: DNA polymerase ligase N-terminal domain-containing protein, partial [Chitinophagaceae bacterium]